MTDTSAPASETEVPAATRVRVVSGTSAEPLLVFQAGFEVGPFTVGTRGDWTLSASGVHPLHARLWFDGQRLLASANEATADVTVDGRRLGDSEWTRVDGGACIALGTAKLSVEYASPIGTASPAAEAPSTPLATTFDEAKAAARPRTKTLFVGFVLVALLLGALLIALGTRTAFGDSRPAPRARASSATTASTLPKPPGAAAQLSKPLGSGSTAPPRPASLPTRALEERAALAVLRGNLAEAAELYSELAATTPTSPVFEAARAISSRRAAAASLASSPTSFGGTLP